VIARVLHAVRLGGHHRVLEIGTGTGYTTALLSERVGDHRVTSIDIDGKLTSRARDALAAVDLHPSVVTGDGRRGHPPRAPYDRVISGCALPYVPPAWIEQTRPGGLILADIAGRMGGATLLAEVGPGCTAIGRFLPERAEFPPSRHPTPLPAALAKDDIARVTHLAPDVVDSPAFAFAAQLHLPGVRRYWDLDDGGRDLFGLAAPDGSWAEVYEADGDGSRLLRQAGPQRLWTVLEDAHTRWQSMGEPDWSRYTFHAAPTGQTVSLDGRCWPLPIEPGT
jgi:SAM-dependent methyltransferase